MTNMTLGRRAFLSATGTATRPNSGEAWDARAQKWTPGSQSFDWGKGAKEWRQAGATLIGGCCRTTPELIGELWETFQRQG